MTKPEMNEEIEQTPTRIKINDNTIDEEQDEDIENYNALDDRKFTVSKTAEDNIEDDKDVIVKEKTDDEEIDNDSDNLFDLIDSMYE